MPDWDNIEKSLDSTKESVVIETLENLVLDGITLDDTRTGTIIPKCIDKLQHHDIKIRSNAIAVIAKQMREENTAMVHMMDDLGKALATPNLLDLKDGANEGEVYNLLHKDLCYVIGELQRRFPGKLMPHYKAVSNYLIQGVANKVVDVATAACQYWSELKPPYAVPPKYTELFVKAVHPKLHKLIPYLINAMEYQEQHEAYLRGKGRSQGSSFRPKTSSKELEQCVSRRNFAALGLENICALFREETVRLFKMNLLAKMKSDKWQQVEAATLALGAFTQALGIPKEMQDAYGDVLNPVIENFKHPNPLVRSISFFTMQKFTNAKLKGVKNPFSRTIKGTLHAINDESMEVQEMGMRCLATLLAYTEQDLEPHATKIRDALINADCLTFGESRQCYYECIAHYFSKLGDSIDAEQAEELSAPLIKEWSNLGWNDLNASSHESVMYLCQSLVVVAMFSKLKFATHNPAILEKAVPFLNKVAESQDASVSSETTTILMVSFLDVISAIFQGQSSNVEKLINRYNIDKCIMKILLNTKFSDNIHESAVGLMGYICEYDFNGVKSHLPEVLQVIDKMMGSKSENSVINALWALTKITEKVEEKNDQLILFANKLGDIFMNTNGEERAIVNAALALTNIGVKYTDAMMAYFSKEEIFVHLFALMHADFDDDKIKIAIFNNLLEIYSPNIKKVNPELWYHFCIAAAEWKIKDEELGDMIKNTIKNVRSSLGTAKWNSVSEKLGRQKSATLRKRYKLY